MDLETQPISRSTQRLYIVAGPTASGKSGLAAALARRLMGRVINADSMQVYRDLHILTARPDATLSAAVPHRLYGVLDGAEPCSAARWAVLAKAEIEDCFEAGLTPIVCGGTGLYLSILRHGIAPIPDIPDELRASVRARHAEIGGAAFREALAKLDPVGAARLHAGDSQRLMRAYEVVAATGAPLHEWQRRTIGFCTPEIAIQTVLLDPPRETLYRSIDDRFVSMVENGALDEVARLIARQLDPALPVMKAVGVAALSAFLRGEIDLAQAIGQARQASRNYAKRQMTWFRHRLTDALILNEQYSETNEHDFCQKICQMG